jgi:hypothetical protein
MSLGTLGIRSERLHDSRHLHYRQREPLRQWQSFSGLLRRGLSQSEEYGVEHAESHPGSIARAHTLFDALPLPLRMTRAAKNKKLTNSRVA